MGDEEVKEIKRFVDSTAMKATLYILLGIGIVFVAAGLQLRHIQTILCEQHQVESCK